MPNSPFPLIHFGREICNDPEQAERREWWLSNGCGGYAAGTISGLLTRRYHGLLLAPLSPPLDRHLLFAKADATLLCGDQHWPLYSNRWAGGVVEPAGQLQIESFHLEGRMPVWRYAVAGCLLECRVWMSPGTNQSHIAWRLLNAPPQMRDQLKLRVNLLVNYRAHHAETTAHSLQPKVHADGHALTIDFDDSVSLALATSGGQLSSNPVWIERMYLQEEAARGLASIDNHWQVGIAELNLQQGLDCGISAGLTALMPDTLDTSIQRFLSHDQQLLDTAGSVGAGPDWIQQLVLAADSFIVERPSAAHPHGKTVIAGYPWFGDWGRDTFIALPGLTLATGRPAVAREILLTFAQYVDQGLLPNRFPDGQQPPEYNSVDAALWYIEAWRAYVESSNDTAALQTVFTVLQSIISNYHQGTRFGIHCDPSDGLLAAGESGMQLTWMDAKIDGWVVTPRMGKPVEINALWYNALKVMAAFSELLGYDSSDYNRLATQAKTGFMRFVRGDGKGLLDVIDTIDDAIRPNQIFAVSLAYSPLSQSLQTEVVDICADTLLCSYGLRSLAADSPGYQPRYEGNARQRDSRYHQGTVWGWLLGPYAWAEYRVHGDAAAAQARLEPMRDHLSDAGLGSISEIFDAQPPHRPRGTPAQAWSVATILDAWWKLEQAKKANV